MADTLKRQMGEIGSTDYWEAVHLYAERQEANRLSTQFWNRMFGGTPFL